MVAVVTRARSALRTVRTPAAIGRLTAALIVLTVIALTGLVGHGNEPARLRHSSGGAWLESPGLGVVSLVDGASREVTATVPVATPGNRIAVSQRGSSAYVTDAGTGAVSLVDGASLDVTRKYAFGEPGTELRVVHGGGAVFVVDAPGRLVTRVDPEKLTVDAALPMPAVPETSQTVVDDDGRLWVVDSLGRGLVWFDEQMHGPFDVVPADARLLVVRGEPVVVRLDVARASPVDPTGGLGTSSCLDLRPDDDVQLLGSGTRDEVFAAISTTGQLVVSDLATHRCSRRVADLAMPGERTDFGPMAQLDQFVFVPNLATGQTAVVDTRTDKVVARLPLTDGGHRVDLVAKDGIVFYNDLDGHKAGVISLDGGSWQSTPVDKFDPDTKAPAVPVDEPDGLPSSPQTPAPQQPEEPEASPRPTTEPSSAPPTARPSPAPGERRTGAPRAPRAPGSGGSGGGGGRGESSPPSASPSAGADDPESPPTITRLVVEGQEEASSSGEVEVRATETLTFDAETDRQVSAWNWTVTGPDGRELPSTDAPAPQTITFDDEGRHAVTVTVTDEHGTSDPATLVVTVLPAPESPPAIEDGPSWEGQPVAPHAGTPITFTAEVAGSVDAWLWELFASGGQSPLQTARSATTAVFTVGTPGTYRVELTVTGPGGSSQAGTELQVVAAPPPLVELEVAIAGPGAVTVSGQQGCADAVCTYQFPVGATVAVAVSPEVRFPVVFDGWTGQCGGSVPSCSFRMPAQRATVGAAFHEEAVWGVIHTGDDCDSIAWQKEYYAVDPGVVEVALTTVGTVWRKGLSLPTGNRDPVQADLDTPDASTRSLTRAANELPGGTLRFWKAKAGGAWTLLPYKGYSIGHLPGGTRITFAWGRDSCDDPVWP